MKRLSLCLALLALASPLVAGTSRYVVLMRTPLQKSHARVINEVVEEQAQQRDVRTYRTIDAFAANLTDEEVAELRASSDVRVVETIKERHINDDLIVPRPAQPAFTDTPSDSPFNHQIVPYGIDLVHAPQVWSVGRGENINVAIVDTGVDSTHPDLKDNYAGGFNAYAPNGQPIDDHRHGTHVAGTVAAENNDIGVVGVAPSARIWAVKVLDTTGFGDNEHIAAGIDWIIAKKREIGGNWIISMSLGSKDPSDIEEAAVKRAAAEGILLVAAAGNNSWPFLDYPAAYDNVMAVAAVDSDKKLATFTNSGSTLSVAAPGVNVISTVPTGVSFVADVQSSAGDLFAASALRGSPKTDFDGDFIFCGYGRPEDIPSAVTGKIALIRRGNPDRPMTFNEKVRNAKASGAKAVIILNGKENIDDEGIWTLILPDCSDATKGCHDSDDDVAFDWPLTVGMTYADGEKLLALIGKATITESYRADDYARFSGTSMATPHVSATAALIWSLNPTLTAQQVRAAIEDTAEDLGTPGVDPQYGHGVINALAAAQRVAPEKFGLPPIPPRRHGSGH
jgi:subtilisin family serine protease